ncbi:MAG: SurA N-terminal domain-containing protein [Nitrospirota bacterium]
MLHFMRKHAKFFYVFFFLIIISFIGFYAGPLDKSTTIPLAEVGKERITLDDYYRTYDRAKNLYRDIYKEKFDEEMEKKLRLKEKVLESLIEEKVLLLAAKEIGIVVKDEELREAIIHDPTFTKNGVFDEGLYLRIPERERIIIENDIRQKLTLLKITRFIGESVDLTDDKIQQMSGDEKIAKALRQTVLADKRERAIKSYVDGLKKQMKIKINTELIS